MTDRRSGKVAEAALNPAAEVAWYLPVTREQYRVSGTLDVVQEGRGNAAAAAAAAAAGAASGDATTAASADADAALAAARRKAWANMSDAGRAQFVWPHPGLPRIGDDEAAFTRPAPDGAGDPAADFCLVVLRVDAVDYINLRQNRRIVFTRRRQQQQQQGDAAQQQQQQQQAADGSAAAADSSGSSDGEGGDGGDGGEGEGRGKGIVPRPTAEWDAVEVNP